MMVLGMRLHFPSVEESVTLLIVTVVFGLISWSGVVFGFYSNPTAFSLFEGLFIGALTASVGASIVRYKWRAMLFIVLIQLIISLLLNVLVA